MLAHDSAPDAAVATPDIAHERPLALDGGLVLTEACARGRSTLERFVARRFRETYNAQVTQFLPRLFGARDVHGRLVAVFGLRRAIDGPLFLEQYLDMTIEAAIASIFGAPVGRHAIAEVGNLAGATPGALRSLIPALTQRLFDEGFTHVAFTGSGRLCNGFARLGLPLRVVAAAEPDRLPATERQSWGRYYQSAPAVMVGDVSVGVRLLEAYARHPQVLRAQLAPLAGVGAP